MPFTGGRQFSEAWLDRVLGVDAQCPGFLRHLLTASRVRRHVILLILADRRRKHGAVEIADHSLLAPLMAEGPRELLKMEFGLVPLGMLGTLARLEEDLPASLYSKLLIQFQEQTDRAKAIQQVAGPLTARMIHAALHVHRVAIHGEALAALQRDAGRVPLRTFNATVDLIQATCSHATDAVLRDSLIASTSLIRDWLDSWLRRTDKLPYRHVVPADDPIFLPCLSGPECEDWGRKLRNCLGARASLLAVGKVAYAVTRDPPHVVVELQRLTGGLWLVSDLAGAKNAEPAPDQTQLLLDHLDSLGILRPWSLSDDAESVERNVLGHHFLLDGNFAGAA